MATIMVLTAGSTGDVEPFAVLAGVLAKRGHTVTLAADARFERLAPGGRVEFAPIRADFHSLLPTPERKRPSLRGEVFPVIRGMLEDSWMVARSRQPGIIVAHQKSLAAPHLAEKLGIPHVRALTVPMLTPTRAFAVPGLVRHNLGGLLNRASYGLVGLLSAPYSGLIRSWRGESLALAPRGKPPAAVKTLYCYSPSLVATPADWPPDTVATGYWLRDQAGADRVDPALDGFVAAGAPPIYVGFGSSVGPDPASLGAAVSEALHRAGVRAVIASGWGAMSNLRSNSDTFVVESAPHRWLFPALRLLSITAEPERLPPVLLRPARLSSALSKAISTFGPRLSTEPVPGRSRCQPTSSPLRILHQQSAQPFMTPRCKLAPPSCRSGSLKKTAPHGHQRRSRAP